MAMVGGSFYIPIFTASWPTGEFGGMGLEGAVKLGYKKELEAVKMKMKEKNYSITCPKNVRCWKSVRGGHSIRDRCSYRPSRY
ncbi:MAG: hypothetical protein Ct9H90mP7_1880 [Candidatus Neomarinimicrobiota bacterium]|nr:MAG: hypothetical protein Ct9H90mP7_1880 [Candidatus Neomarinimicrobiota bacterium]